MKVKNIKNGMVYWGSLDEKAIVTNAKINTEKNVIAIDAKESPDFPGFSITLSSLDGINYNGKYNSIDSNVHEDKSHGTLTMKYYNNKKAHVLTGRWVESGERILCVIELNES